MFGGLKSIYFNPPNYDKVSMAIKLNFLNWRRDFTKLIGNKNE